MDHIYCHFFLGGLDELESLPTRLLIADEALNFFALSNLSPNAFAAGFLGAAGADAELTALLFVN